MHLAPNKISILFCNGREERRERRERQRIEGERGESLEGRISIYAHSLACSICQLHADVTPPRAAHLPALATTCPPSPSTTPLPSLPWQHKSQSILHNAMRAWLNGGVTPILLPSLSFLLPPCPGYPLLLRPLPLPLPLPLHFSHKTCSDVFGFLSLCLHLPHGAVHWERGHKTFYAAFVLLLHSRRNSRVRGGRG